MVRLMDLSEISSGNKKESNPKFSYGIFYSFLAIALLILYFHFIEILDTNQLITLLLTDAFLFVSSLSLILSTRQLIVSKLQEEAARESILASRDSIKSAVAPRLIFRVRPANDYWKGPHGMSHAGWEQGVGIYIENFGLGPALNIRLSVKAVGEKEQQTCEAEFIRLLVGWKYTLPSKEFPQLSVDENHDRIIIESLEYDDIRNPPNHYRDEEPEILELKPEDFDESEREKIEKMGSSELGQVRNVIKILEFLGKQERTDAGEAWTFGEEIQSETGLVPYEINDAIENAERRRLVEIRHPPPNFKPWKFVRVTITSLGRLWLEDALSDKTDPSKIRL